MATTHSPLRYPGGKASLWESVARIIRLNGMELGHYAEPYAGGCGLALGLLYRGLVSDVHVNDLDPAIWAFWHAVLRHTEALVERIHETPVTVEEWRRQRAVQLDPDTTDLLSLALSTFYLNRTNRSGVIKSGGVIGGLDQNGPYKIGCRFNKEDLVKRIRRVATYEGRIHLHNLDALDFLDHVERRLPKKTFCYIDPPYLDQGSSLYTSHYRAADHQEVAARVLRLDRPWILTYDRAPLIEALYRSRRHYELSPSYSLQNKRVGSEMMVASKGLKIPPELKEHQTHRPRCGPSHRRRHAFAST